MATRTRFLEHLYIENYCLYISPKHLLKKQVRQNKVRTESVRALILGLFDFERMQMTWKSVFFFQKKARALM